MKLINYIRIMNYLVVLTGIFLTACTADIYYKCDVEKENCGNQNNSLDKD